MGEEFDLEISDLSDIFASSDFRIFRRVVESGGAVRAICVPDLADRPRSFIDSFEKWIKTLAVVPTIVSLKEKAEIIRQTEIKKSLTGLQELTPAQIQHVENLTASITEKIINDPILVLKRKAERSTRDTYIDMMRKLFKLDQDNGEGE